jgi:uncharacterized protein
MSQVINYHGLAISKDKIAEFCHRWKITGLALFGSILRDDFRPDSDVDVLVTFAPDAHWRFYDLLSMKEELEAMFGRQVDLVEKRLVESSENYIRREHILNTWKPSMRRDLSWVLDMLQASRKAVEYARGLNEEWSRRAVFTKMPSYGS